MYVSSLALFMCCFVEWPAFELRLRSDKRKSGHSGSAMEYKNGHCINGDEAQFAFTPTDKMFIAKCMKGGKFTEGKIVPFGNIGVNPASAIFNYGQGMFEGMKAYRTEDDRILLFRPDQNAIRMKTGAERMCMNAPSIDFFIDAVKKTVLANKKWVPRAGEGALYIRPLLIGTGPTFCVSPAREFTFLIYAMPVKTQLKETTGITMKVDDKNHRAHRGGTGGVKSCTNYSPNMKPLNEARLSGYTDVVHLDAATGKNVEETPVSNVFIVKGNVVATPALIGTVLPGITRKSIIELARDLGYQVEERTVPVEELLEADEVFCTGTAVVVRPVETLTYHDDMFTYKTGKQSLGHKLKGMLTNIQTGCVEDKKGWTVEIESA